MIFEVEIESSAKMNWKSVAIFMWLRWRLITAFLGKSDAKDTDYLQQTIRQHHQPSDEENKTKKKKENNIEILRATHNKYN